MQKKCWLLFLAGVLPLFCLYSCRTTKLASTVTNDLQTAKKISGLKYYVGKDLLILNVKKATVSAKKVTEALEIKSNENIEYEGKVAVQTVPDMDFAFTLAIKPGSLDASKFKIELYENGIVKSINVESVGEGGEIGKNVFRFAGTIASFVSPTSIPFLAASILDPTFTRQAGGRTGAEEKPKAKDEKEKEYEARCLNEIEFSRFDEIEIFKSLAKELRFFLQCDQRACDLWKEMHDVEKNINDSFKRKNELLRRLPNVPAGEVRAIKAEIDWINSENEKRSVLLSAKDSQFRIIFDAFMEKAGIGKQSKNEAFPGQFAIDQIPAIDRLEYMQSIVACLHGEFLKSTDIKGKLSKISNFSYKEFFYPDTRKLDRCILETKLEDAKIEIGKIGFVQSCEKCPKICVIHEEILKAVKSGAKKKLDYWISFIKGLNESEKIDPLMMKNFSKDLADLQGLVFSEIRKSVQKQIDSQLGDFKEAREFFNKSGVLVFINHFTNFGKKLNQQTAIPEVRGSPVVYYRQTIPVQISFYCLDSEGNLSKISDEKIDVLHPQMPIYYFTFSWNALATRTLGLLFNSKGQPMVFEQTSSSAAKNLTGSLADSLKVARDEYADSLKKITEIQDSQRKIKMDDLSTKIEQMKKEKELIDTQLEKEAVTSNYDLILRQRQLAAELDVLQKEFALEKTTDTGLQELELVKLKLELEQLKQELEILKIKLELGKK